jgi:hypothetical protein
VNLFLVKLFCVAFFRIVLAQTLADILGDDSSRFSFEKKCLVSCTEIG